MSPDALLEQPAPPEPEADEPDSRVAPDYGPDNRDLPKQLQDGLRAAIVKVQGQEKFSRRREVMRARRDRFYETGNQHIQWNNSLGGSGGGGFSVMTPGGLGYNSSGMQTQCPQYIDDYNIFQRYLLILTSVGTQNSPGVNFQPIDPTISEDIDKAKTAETYAKAFNRMNDTKSLEKQIWRMMGLDGRTVSWTRTEKDAQRFGLNADGTPKSFQRTTIQGVLETKVPLMAREFDKTFGYCLIYDDIDTDYAKTEYADFPNVDEIKSGVAALGENMYERTARLGVLSGSRSYSQIGDSLTHLTSRVNGFLRPSNFTGPLYDAPCEDSPDMTLGERLNELFPQGCRVVFIGDSYFASYAECMDDHIDIQFPYEGDGMSRPPFMDCMVVVQDGFNDDMNWCREKFDTGAGATWINADDVELEAVTSQRAAPNAIRGRKARTGLPLESEFFEEKDPELPESLLKFIQMLWNELPQFMLAALPSLQGDAETQNKTASGYAQARAQAMGQLGIIFSATQRMWSRIRYQSALAASQCDDMQGKLTIPGAKDEQSLTVDMDKLRKGNFGCYPDEDSSFPENTQQKRAAFNTLLTMAGTNPQMMQELDNPDNWELAKRMFGLDELVILASEARDKQISEIEKLVQQNPIPPSPEEIQQADIAHGVASVQARALGQPEPPPPDDSSLMKPSIPIDPLMDYSQWEGAKCQEWLSSAARREIENQPYEPIMYQGQPWHPGVLNVRLHGLEHMQVAAANAAKAAAMAPPPAAAHPAHKPPAKPEPTKPAAPPAMAA